MEELSIRIDSVTKEYRLGAIGGTTLRDDLQRLGAKIRGKDDPTRKIGSQAKVQNEKFLALDNVSFTVKKGEVLGIIGHNGAGKSTLLKLLARVTAPTAGTISYNGRIASMLEVGTGFHPELTGRENVYMNGAILGMTKAEIDEKFEEIVSFAEMEQFIDTPVKRYSSGMYVKLAFAVAAHLDSEILVMDEVLAVGDMKFQQKCLGKMGEAANRDGRTVLYVSHNMNTIRQLCTRCLVLDHGKLIFDGDVETAIGIYAEYNNDESVFKNYRSFKRPSWISMDNLRLLSAQLINYPGFIQRDEEVQVEFEFLYTKQLENICLRYEVLKKDDTPIGTSVAYDLPIKANQNPQKIVMHFFFNGLISGEYKSYFTFFSRNEFGANKNIDWAPGLQLKVQEPKENMNLNWDVRQWGHIQFSAPVVDAASISAFCDHEQPLEPLCSSGLDSCSQNDSCCEKSIILISCYFGKLPENLPLFIKTVRCNKSVDFLLITDCILNTLLPDNFKVLNISFAELRQLFQKHFDFPIVLDKPYKICDYRPVFGLAFSKYIDKYDFWGHCDLDVVFGDLRKFLPDSVLSSYDKIYQLGHLLLYRNSSVNNRRYLLPGGVDYRQAFTTVDSALFDEIAGMQRKFEANDLPVYLSRDYADITYLHVRFTLSNFMLSKEQIKNNNYDKQLFFWEKGHVYRAYLEDETVKYDEFNYLHFGKRKMPIPENISGDAFYLTYKGAFPKTSPVALEDFDRYNLAPKAEERARTRECNKTRRRRKQKYYLNFMKWQFNSKILRKKG